MRVKMKNLSVTLWKLKCFWLKFRINRLFNKTPIGWDYTVAEISKTLKADDIDLCLAMAEIIAMRSDVDLVYQTRSKKKRALIEHASLDKSLLQKG
jgi:hypothetical protein